MFQTIPRTSREIISQVLELLPEPHSIHATIYPGNFTDYYKKEYFKISDVYKKKFDDINFDIRTISVDIENPTKEKLLQIIHNGDSDHKEEKAIQLDEAYFFIVRNDITHQDVTLTLNEYGAKIKVNMNDKEGFMLAIGLIQKLNKLPDFKVELNS